MARRQSQNAISLFPFLAVLVCTMGALILLLLVTTRRIRHEQTVSAAGGLESEEPTGFASDLASDSLESLVEEELLPSIAFGPFEATEEDFEANPPSQEPVTSFEEGDYQVYQDEADQLRRQLDAEAVQFETIEQQLADKRRWMRNAPAVETVCQSRQLERLKAQKLQLDDSLRKKRERLTRLQAELDSRSEKTEQVESLLDARKSGLISLREIVRQEESKAGSDATIVEFTNSTGTERTPILIEVTDSGYRFLPWGIEIGPADMRGFPANDNPILAAITALHTHRHPQSISVKPYVLLVVRPQGSSLFYPMQRHLAGAGIHFGYELVEQGRDISVGKVASTEKVVVETAVHEAIQRRDSLYGTALAHADGQHNGLPRKSRQGMRVMPDGRILFAEDADEGHNGRFYAAGIAPPETPPKLFAEPNETPNQSSQESSVDRSQQRVQSGNETQSPEQQLAGQLNQAIEHRDSVAAADAQRETSFADDSASMPDFYSATESDDTDASIPEIVSRHSGYPAAKGKHGAYNPEQDKFLESAIASSDERGLDSLGRLDAAGSLSANLGIRPEQSEIAGTGGHDESEFVIADNDTRSSAARQHTQNSTEAAGVDQWSLSQRLRNGADTDRTDSSERSDWPELTYTDVDQDTRTVGSPENPSASAPGSPSSTPTFGVDGGWSGQPVASDGQSLLEQHVDATDELNSVPDPYLSALMQTATSNDPALAGHQAVQIHIRRQYIAVGSLPPFSTRNMESREVLAETLERLATVVQEKMKRERREVAPTIDYVVGPEGAAVHQHLQAGLEAMKVPTRTITNERATPELQPATENASSDKRPQPAPDRKIRSAGFPRATTGTTATPYAPGSLRRGRTSI